MAITINGTGSITGLTAGGLPDGSVTADDLAADAVTSAKIATDAVTSAKIASGTIVDADVNASAAIADSKLTGTTCKAWVNFNGSGTLSIRASHNVNSVTDNGTGNYRVNFASSFADSNYSAQATINTLNDRNVYVTDPQVDSCDIDVVNPSGQRIDSSSVNVAIFR